MVRISDILKHRGRFPQEEPAKDKKEEKGTPDSSPQQSSPEEPVSKGEKIAHEPGEGMQVGRAMAKERPEAEKEMQVVKAMHEMQLDPEESKRIYSAALKISQDILDKIQRSPANLPNLEEAYEIVRVIVDRMVLGDKELIALTVGYSEDNYLYAHSVNVSILAIDVGLGLGYNKSRLNELGLGAFLHDLGMVKVMDIAKQPRKLIGREFEEIKKHPLYSSEILSAIKNIQEGVIYIAKQQHERINGTGYPEGLKDDQIHEYAKIVAVLDVYEALVHPRPHRKAISGHEALKELLNMNTAMVFETRILKFVINRVGLYPIGCWVELNSGEIGKVILANSDSPLRPKVNIVFSPEKEKLPQIKLIDLTRHTNVYIKRSVNPQDLKLE